MNLSFKMRTGLIKDCLMMIIKRFCVVLLALLTLSSFVRAQEMDGAAFAAKVGETTTATTIPTTSPTTATINTSSTGCNSCSKCTH